MEAALSRVSVETTGYRVDGSEGDGMSLPIGWMLTFDAEPVA